VTFALAHRGEVPCGRIVGIVNRREVEARVSGLDASGGSSALTTPRSRGRSSVRRELGEGPRDDAPRRPMGFSDQDPEGFWIEGFEHEPTISTYSNHPFMGPLVESCGFGKEIDFVVYKAALGKPCRSSTKRLRPRSRADGVQDRRVPEQEGARAARGDDHPSHERDVRGPLRLRALDEEEIEALAKKYLPLLDPASSSSA